MWLKKIWYDQMSYIFKVDFEKVRDYNWDFLEYMLRTGKMSFKEKREMKVLGLYAYFKILFIKKKNF